MFLHASWSYSIWRKRDAAPWPPHHSFVHQQLSHHIHPPSSSSFCAAHVAPYHSPLNRPSISSSAFSSAPDRLRSQVMTPLDGILTLGLPNVCYFLGPCCTGYHCPSLSLLLYYVT